MPISFAGLIAAHGAPAVFFLLLFGVVPSEVVLPMAGAAARPNVASLALVAIAGVAAYQASAVFWYWVGRRVGYRRCRRWVERRGRWFGLTVADLDAAADWFRRRGTRAVLLSRALPLARAIVCLPAGAAGLGFGRFFAAALIGSVVWCGLLTTAGFLLAERYGRLLPLLDRIAWVALAAAAGILLVRWSRVRRDRAKADGP